LHAPRIARPVCTTNAQNRVGSAVSRFAEKGCTAPQRSSPHPISIAVPSPPCRPARPVVACGHAARGREGKRHP
jgi:hypothetical protein